MMLRLRLAVRLLTFAIAIWILGVVLWGLATGEKHTPLIAVWLFIAGMVTQLILWVVSIATRRA